MDNQLEKDKMVDKMDEFDEFLAGFDIKDKNHPHKYFFDQILLTELKKLLIEKHSFKF